MPARSPFIVKERPMGVKEPPVAATVLSMVVQPEYIKRFICFFTEGVSLPITTGGTLKGTICEQLGVAEDYFEERIQTIFLNFKAVDKPEKARVNADATITLSAAMPGLVGATMRRGGTFANLRSSISFVEIDGDIEKQQGLITLKLLNMVGRELGPAFLANGVYLTGEQWAAFLSAPNSDLKDGCRELSLNAEVTAWDQLRGRDWSGQMIFLRVLAC